MLDYETICDQDFLPYIEKHIQQPLIQKLFINQLKYYMRSATMCRTYYYVSAALTIVLPTLVTVVSSLSGFCNMHFINVFTAIVAGLSAIISGFSSLFKWQENWLRFRIGVEQLKKESINYIAGVDAYSNSENRDMQFLKTIQNIADDMNAKDILQFSKTDTNIKDELEDAIYKKNRDI